MKKILLLLCLLTTHTLAAATADEQPTTFQQLALKFCESVQKNSFNSKKTGRAFRNLRKHFTGETDEECAANPIANKEHPIFQSIIDQMAVSACQQEDSTDTLSFLWVIKSLYGKKDKRSQDIQRHLINKTIDLNDLEETISVARALCDLNGPETADVRKIMAHMASMSPNTVQQAKMGLAFFIHHCDPNDEAIKAAELKYLEAIPEKEKCKTIIRAYQGYSLTGNPECMCCFGAGWQFGKRRHHAVVDFLLANVLNEKLSRIRFTIDLMHKIYDNAPPPQVFPIAERFVEQSKTPYNGRNLKEDITLLGSLFGNDSPFTQELVDLLGEEIKKEDAKNYQISPSLRLLAQYRDKNTPFIQEIADLLTEKCLSAQQHYLLCDPLDVLSSIYGYADHRVQKLADLLYEVRDSKNRFDIFLKVLHIFDKQDPHLQSLLDEIAKENTTKTTFEATLKLKGPQDPQIELLAGRLYEETLTETDLDVVYKHFSLLNDILVPEKKAILLAKTIGLIKESTRWSLLGAFLLTASPQYDEESEIFVATYDRLIELDLPFETWIHYSAGCEKHAHKRWHQKLGQYLVSKGQYIPKLSKKKDMPWGVYT